MNQENKIKIWKSRYVVMYVSIAFFVIYGLLSIIYLATNKNLFQGYGLFTNDQRFIYIVIVLLFSLFFALLVFFSCTNKKIKDYRLLMPSQFKYLIFLIYSVMFLIACFDYMHRYNVLTLSLSISNINSSMSQLGYDVAHSDGKLSYTLISLFPFLFLFFSYDREKKIKIVSFIYIIVTLLILFISGRKEQLLAGIIALVFRFKFTRDLRTLTIIGIPSLVLLVYFMNSVRGGLSSESIFYVLFQSQESYPLALGAYLIVNPLNIQLDTLFNSVMPYTVLISMPTITGVINQELFKTHEYGPVYSILGFMYYYFPISLFIVFIISKLMSLKINTLLSWGREYTPIVVFYCVKFFILLRNGYLNFFLWDVFFSLVVFSLCFVFKYKESR